MNKPRTLIVASLAANLVLIAIVAATWWHFRSGIRRPDAAPAPMAAPASDAPSAPAEKAEPSLAPVQLSPQRMQSIGVQTGEVQRKRVSDDIRTTGNVAIDETRLAYVQLRFSGYIQKVFVDATYQYVRKGQPLFTIYSPELVAAEREYLVARQNRHNLSRSTDSTVVSDAASLMDAAAARLKQWDIPQQEIERLEQTGEVKQELEFDSPVAGYVTEREALPNKYVQPESRLYTVADLSSIWVFAQVFQIDLSRVKAGESATLTVDTYPDRSFAGRVDFIYPDIDMSTRTARVRLVFPNPGLTLLPGMFVNVALRIPMGERLVIPATGVLQSGERSVAFVDQGGGTLEPREVQLGARVGDDIIVLTGLKEGEKIVTSANFLIDSESQLQAALGTFTPPPPGAGAAASTNGPQAQLELSTEPDPPHKGGNLVRAKLTSANGVPITGAEVNATFFMAAMPAMGMAAMRVPVTLSDKGGGVYEGSGQLESGGTWQVTLVAKKGSQVVASRQLSVNATGGM